MISRYKYDNENTPDFSKRYWYAFICGYYPSGFLNDVNATCDTLEELKTLKNNIDEDDKEVFWDNREFKEIEVK